MSNVPTPTLFASLLAYPKWTALFVLGILVAASVSAATDDRLDLLERVGIVLAYFGMSVALKLLIMVGARVWINGRFVLGEFRHIGAIVAILVISIFVAAPAMISMWHAQLE